MKLGIICASDPGDITTTKNNNDIAELVTRCPYTIVMGAEETGSMASVKEIAKYNGREILVIGNEIELQRVRNADMKIPVTTIFEQLEQIYQNSDAILFLSGGTETLAAFYTFFYNKLKTKEEKPLIVYNGDHSFDPIKKDFDLRSRKNLTTRGFLEYFDLVYDIDKLAESLQKAENIYNEEKGKVK